MSIIMTKNKRRRYKYSETIINCSLIATFLACALLMVAAALDITILEYVTSALILALPLSMFCGIVIDIVNETKVYEIKKGEGIHKKGKYVITHKGAEYSFPNEEAAAGLFIDVFGDIHRNRKMAEDIIIG